MNSMLVFKKQVNKIFKSNKSLLEKYCEYLDLLYPETSIQGWNLYDADPIDKDVYEECKHFFEVFFNFLENINHSFTYKDFPLNPVADNSLQFETENDTHYIEIQIYKNKCTIYVNLYFDTKDEQHISKEFHNKEDGYKEFIYYINQYFI